MLLSKKYNDGYAYIMVGTDVFSRFALAQAIKSKKGEVVTESFKALRKERAPLYLQTDKGKEFLNKNFQANLKKRGITFFTGENSDIKCSLAERFNSTLQSKMWQYFSHYEKTGFPPTTTPFIVQFEVVQLILTVVMKSGYSTTCMRRCHLKP